MNSGTGGNLTPEQYAWAREILHMPPLPAPTDHDDEQEDTE